LRYIYLDENLSEHVASALNLLNKGYFEDVEVNSTKNAFGKGVTDEDLIPQIGKQNGVLVTRDFKIEKTKLQNELLRENGVGASLFNFPKT